MTLAKVKEQDGMTLAKVKEQDGMTLAKVNVPSIYLHQCWLDESKRRTQSDRAIDGCKRYRKRIPHFSVAGHDSN